MDPVESTKKWSEASDQERKLRSQLRQLQSFKNQLIRNIPNLKVFEDDFQAEQALEDQKHREHINLIQELPPAPLPVEVGIVCLIYFIIFPSR